MNATEKFNQEMPPFSSDYFAALSLVEKILLSLSAVLVLCTLALFFEHAVYILCRYRTPRSVRFRSVQIVGIYPALSLSAFLGLCVPRAVTLCYFVSSCYLAMAMYNFVMLIDQYFGGKHRVISMMKGATVSLRTPPICCCLCCLPSVQVNGKTIRYLKLLVLQGVLVQPLIGFLAVVLWLDGRLTLGSTDFGNASIYMAYFLTLSTLLSVYGLVLCYKASRQILSALDIGPKYAALQMVTVFYGMQNAGFSVLAKFGVPEHRGILTPMVRSYAYMNMLLILEMFILSLVARCLYRHPHQEVTNVQSFSEADNDGSNSQLHKRMSGGSFKNDISLVNYLSSTANDDDIDIEKLDDSCGQLMVANGSDIPKNGLDQQSVTLE